jgi:DNA-binding response OmpR family regulator
MVPDFALRIQAMIRSLREVILPALPGGQMLAIDQTNILIGYLRIMALQHDKVFDYLLAELAEYTELVEAMVKDSGDGQDDVVRAARTAVAQAKPILRMSIPPQSELADRVRALKTSADDLLCSARQSGLAARSQALANRVMEQAGKQILRERAWFRASGFELDADKLPSIDEVLYGRRETAARGLE